MYKRILVPVDGSKTSMKAIGNAIALAKAFDGAVTAIYVIDPYPFSGVGSDFANGQAQYLSAVTAEAEGAVKMARDQFEAAGVAIETLVVEARAPSRGILEAATTTHADLIVMGSHGRRGLEKLVLGSVAQSVLQHAHLPVLVVRD